MPLDKRAVENIMRPMFQILFCFATCITISACSPVVAQRGNMLAEHQLEDVRVNEHTRSDVLRMLGSPTTQSTFNPNVWYYIGQETAKHGIMDDKVMDEKIVTVVFDKQGVVRQIENKSGARVDVPISGDQTKTFGNELTFMQQLLGNVGKFNTSQSSPTDLGRP